MPQSVIIWASDIPGLEIEEEIIHPANQGEVDQDPEVINWWKAFAFTCLYCISNGCSWEGDPAVKREAKRILISGQILKPSPWIEKANLSIAIKPKKNLGFYCNIWYEDASASPAPLERNWFCSAPKGDQQMEKLVTSVYKNLINAFVDYKPTTIQEEE